MANNVSLADMMKMNSLARLFVRDGSLSALEEARLLFAVALNEEERKTLRWWWNEGCRDYSDGEYARRENLAMLEK